MGLFHLKPITPLFHQVSTKGVNFLNELILHQFFYMFKFVMFIFFLYNNIISYKKQTEISLYRPSTVTVNMHVAIFPAESWAVKVIGVIPIGKTLFDGQSFPNRMFPGLLSVTCNGCGNDSVAVACPGFVCVTMLAGQTRVGFSSSEKYSKIELILTFAHICYRSNHKIHVISKIFGWNLTRHYNFWKIPNKIFHITSPLRHRTI